MYQKRIVLILNDKVPSLSGAYISWLSWGFGWDSSIETSTTGGEKNPGGVADLDD